MLDIFIARQPIYDRRLDVFAYELLYRSSATNRAGEVDGDQATSSVILHAFTEIGLEHMVGPYRAFINLTRGFLVSDNPLPFPRDKVVLEILEDVTVDQALLDAVERLSHQGFCIALDDFVYATHLEPLVKIADIIKIDLRALSRGEVRDHVMLLRRFNARLLAEKVETRDEFEFCRDAGFDYFQGYFFCRPHVVRSRSVPPNRLAILQLLAKLQDPNVPVDELEQLISQDLSLSYKLLRYINSAFFSLPKKIDSIQHAVVYLGQSAIKALVTLIALAGIEDKPHELLKTAMVRAKMCETLAEATGREAHKDSFFTVGLFSAMDALLDSPMEKIVASLPLSDEVTNALLQHRGPAGDALRCTLAYEQGDWEHVTCPTIPPAAVREAYLKAIAWADETQQKLVA